MGRPKSAGIVVRSLLTTHSGLLHCQSELVEDLYALLSLRQAQTDTVNKYHLRFNVRLI